MMTKLAQKVTTITPATKSLAFPDLEFFKIEDNRQAARFALAIKSHQVVIFAPELSLTQCVNWSEGYYKRALEIAEQPDGKLYGIQREMITALNTSVPGTFVAGEVRA